MIPNDQKLKLLDTRITELGLGDGVNKNFAFDALKKPIASDDVLTLGEFITLNQKVLKRSQLLICNKKGQTMMALSSPHGKILESFLAEKGFDKHDWILLAPQGSGKEYKDLSSIDKEILKQLPYVDVCQMVKSSETTRCIDQILELRKKSKEENALSLESFLQLSKEQFSWVYFNQSYPFKTLLKLSASFIRTQKKLIELGFTKEDGPFMCIPPRSFSKKDFQVDAKTFQIHMKGQLEFGFLLPIEVKINDEIVHPGKQVA